MANNFHLSESELDLEVQKNVIKTLQDDRSGTIEIKYLALSVCLTMVIVFFFLIFTTQELRTVFSSRND
jgi:hypothetical protein